VEVVTGSAAHLLRARVVGGHDQKPCACVESRAGFNGARIEKLGYPKIQQFGIAALGHQDVAGLDVPVDDQILVRELNGIANAAKKFNQGFETQSFVAAVFGDRCPRNVFHNEPRRALFSGAAIEQRCDKRMFQGREDLPLVPEPVEGRCV
jgi:hypothetical protein